METEALTRLVLENLLKLLSTNGCTTTDTTYYVDAVNVRYANTVADIRHSILPHEINALWGGRLDPQASMDQHVDYVESSGRSPEVFKKLWEMIKR